MALTITPDFSKCFESQKASEVPKEMLSVVREGGRSLVRINSSSLSLIQTCMRKAHYSLEQRWLSKHTSPPLIFGTAIHKALEVFYTYSSGQRYLPDNFEDVAQGLIEGHEAPEHFMYTAIKAFIEKAEPLRNLPYTDKRSLVSGVWMLTKYFETYLHDTYVVHSDAQGPMIERRCEGLLYEDERLAITLFGTIDIVMQNEVTGEVLPADHKTTSMMGNEFLNRIKPNSQYTGYLWLAKNNLGLSGENFLVNGLQTKARPLTSRGGPPTFTRQVTRRTAQDFKEFIDVVLFTVRNYLRSQTTGIWPLGTVDACASYGSCQYLDICSAPNELRNNILESKFERHA